MSEYQDSFSFYIYYLQYLLLIYDPNLIQDHAKFVFGLGWTCNLHWKERLVPNLLQLASMGQSFGLVSSNMLVQYF